MSENSPKIVDPATQDVVSAAIAIAVTALFVCIGFLLWRQNIQYGIAVFVAAPALIGIVAAVCDCYLFDKPKGMSLLYSFIGAFAIVTLLLFEGIICLMMASPILWLFGWITYRISHAIFNKYAGPFQSTWAVMVVGFCIWSVVHRPDTVIETHVSTLVVNSTPDKIYPYFFNLDEVDKQSFSILGFGFAHPTKVVSAAKKVGARRECQLTTGVMGEEITELIPNRRLAFKVLNTPASMKETNPFGEVEAGHLKGNFECIEGKFDLTPLPNGRTLITGTSKYRYRFYPEAYWGLFTREIVREVQISVMNTIKRKVESAT